MALSFTLLPACVGSNTFHILRPTKAPGFVYAWLELISHRIFIARMLAHTPQQKVRPVDEYGGICEGGRGASTPPLARRR